MKTLGGSLIATIVGLAMLVAGIAGVAGAFESDEDGGSSSQESADCTPTDGRITDLATFDMDAGVIVVNCEGDSYEASFLGTGIGPARKGRTLALWLYNSRKDARLVAGLTQVKGDTTPGLSGTLPERTTRFRKWALSEEPPTDGDPRRPTKIIEEAEL